MNVTSPSAAALGIAQGKDVLLQVKDGEQLRMTGTLAEITRPGFCRTFGRGAEPDDPTVFLALQIWALGNNVRDRGRQ